MIIVNFAMYLHCHYIVSFQLFGCISLNLVLSYVKWTNQHAALKLNVTKCVSILSTS